MKKNTTFNCMLYKKVILIRIIKLLFSSSHNMEIFYPVFICIIIILRTLVHLAYYIFVMS